MKIRYTVDGFDADSVLFSKTGVVEGANPVDRDLHWRAVAAAFEQLTQGRATFGKPGEGGCRGPYNITRFVLETIE